MELNYYRLYSSSEITTLMRSLTFVFVVCKQRNGVYAESTLVLFCLAVQTGIHTLVECLLDKPTTRVRSTRSFFFHLTSSGSCESTQYAYQPAHEISVLFAMSSNEGSREFAHMRKLARAFAARMYSQSKDIEEGSRQILNL